MTDAPKTPAQIADDAAETVRALNHATLLRGSEGWRYPADAYDVIGSLHRAVGGLPQALEQVKALLFGLEESGSIYSTTGSTEADLIHVQSSLEAARRLSAQLSSALDRAHQAAGPLAYRDTR